MGIASDPDIRVYSIDDKLIGIYLCSNLLWDKLRGHDLTSEFVDVIKSADGDKIVEKFYKKYIQIYQPGYSEFKDAYHRGAIEIKFMQHLFVKMVQPKNSDKPKQRKQVLMF